jgi:hypothetical protein
LQIKLEDIPQVAIVADQEYHDSILSTSFCHQSQVTNEILLLTICQDKFYQVLIKYPA